MKYIIIVATIVMLLASYLVRINLPDQQTALPVIYWVTDPNPARREQVKLFGQWLSDHDYSAMDLRVDNNNGDIVKKIIHGVSGVGSDLMDMDSGRELQYFSAMGLMADLTETAKTLGFDPSKTYPALRSEITKTDKSGISRQLMFPCNVSVSLYFVNIDTFEKYGQPVPSMRWSIDEFERMGRAFVQAANPPGARRRVFFADMVDLDLLRRSVGVDRFNETMTRCMLDDPRAVAILQRVRDWTYKDRIIPSNADRDGFNTGSGYGGQSPQLFDDGTYAMLFSGRHLFIQWREFNKSRVKQNHKPMHLKLAEPPNGGFPNVMIVTRAAMLYAGSHHPDLAKYFLAFLASAEYNMQIVHDSDALPPNPEYTKTAEFTTPMPNPSLGIYQETEWGNHAPFAESANGIAIGNSHSPFALSVVVTREENLAKDGLLADPPLWNAQTAAKRMTDRINFEIEQNLRENPALQERYNQLLKTQAKIDEYKATGRKIPVKWIENPFHVAYYRQMGMLDEGEDGPRRD